jgi:hypothetical protein
MIKSSRIKWAACMGRRKRRRRMLIEFGRKYRRKDTTRNT